MSDAVLVAIISAVGAMVTGVISVIVLVGVKAVSEKLTVTHMLINSRMDEMLRLTRDAAKAEGVITGKAIQRTEDQKDL